MTEEELDEVFKKQIEEDELRSTSELILHIAFVCFVTALAIFVITSLKGCAGNSQLDADIQKSYYEAVKVQANGTYW